ncbi:hypothetical protein Q8A67_018084 [Cirrhinus molitorella]|uniref:Uncharacterized protein n=1 Tax=Cirrhinus molitorella TaxID=172907 RepID=A0AA88P8H8_9TELE|nr:hypothetical protein Q8A67_018084 [Cirrhinus molitorella]
MSHNLRKRREQGSSKRRARARFLGWDQIPAAGNLWNAAGRGRESLLSLLFGLFLSLCESGRGSSPGRNGKDPIATDRPRLTSKFPYIDALSLQHCQFGHLRTCAHPRAASIVKKVWNDSSPEYYRSCQIAIASEIPLVSDLQRSVGAGRSYSRPSGARGTGDINYNEAVSSVLGARSFVS